MEDFFAWMFLVGSLGVLVCYSATVIAIRKFMPRDWSWSDVQTLESTVLESGIPVSVRRRYALLICFFTLAAITLLPLAVLRGELIGVCFTALVAGGAIYKLVWLWINYRGALRRS